MLNKKNHLLPTSVSEGRGKLGVIPLSFIQQRLWFLDQILHDKAIYNIPITAKITGDLDYALLEEAINSVIERHEILRTIFVSNGDEAQQIVQSSYIIPLQESIVDISDLDDEAQKFRIRAIHEEEASQVFDLAKGPLIKTQVVKLSRCENILLITLHSIISDVFSIGILLREIGQYYSQYSGETENLITPLMLQYSDFALWQKDLFEGDIFNEKLSYWRDQLLDAPALSELPTDHHRSQEVVYDNAYYNYTLSKSIRDQLVSVTENEQVILSTVLLAALQVLIYKYSGQKDLVIGTPIDNRHIDNVNNLIGNITNVLALRVVLQGNESFQDVFKSLNKTILQGYKNGDYPFEQLLDNLNIDKALNRSPLFQVMFVLQDSNTSKNNLRLPGLKVEVYDNFYPMTNVDFLLHVHDDGEQLNIRIKYNGNLYENSSIERITKCFIKILENIVQDHTVNINKLSILTSEDTQIIHDWNNTDAAYPEDKTIHRLFEEQVVKTPDSVAVVYEDARLTYSELNLRANQLANYIISTHDIKPDTLIALCLDRSEHMIIAILACLKAGGAYVPIDPTYPDERIQYILQDTGANIILTNEQEQTRLATINSTTTDATHSSDSMQEQRSTTILAIDNQEIQEQLSQQLPDNPTTDTTSSNLAYVIYTSGTTGNPKGVMIEHKGVVNLLSQNILQNKFKPNKQGALWTNIVFDVSVYEIFTMLLNGCALHVVSNTVRADVALFISYISEKKINYAYIPPYFLSDFSRDYKGELEFILLGVDKIQFTDIGGSLDNNSIEIINGYGPTEATVFCSRYIYDKDNRDLIILPIGSPISNTMCYVLSSSMTPMPIGAVGELYIGGVGLARGYLNRPDLTAEKFIDNPFQSEEESKLGKNARLYRTGDLVRWLPCGNLEYIGRNDFQVKIRGYRIELGEIETALSGYPGIKQSVVLAQNQLDQHGQPTASKYVVAYCVKALDLQETDAEDFVNTWETIYQSEYLALDSNNFKQNITGWNSSYTEEAIPKEDMLEWIENTTTRIKDLEPKIILEIGSGSGLILFNIIDHCDYYYATDFSKNVIDYTNAALKKFEYDNKVTTIACAADQLPYSELDKAFDTVILNSITQYFPNLDYLESVIIDAISHINSNGQIFIGDIRDYRLLKCFHHSILSYKNKVVTKAEVDFFVRRDKELLVSPEYFAYLKTINKFIAGVEIVPKLGIANHEMNNYRYDVVLHINKEHNQNNHYKLYDVVIDESQFVKISDLDSYFASNTSDDYVCIKYINKRIIQDYASYSELSGSKLKITKEDDVLTINEIASKTEAMGYELKLLLDIHDPLYLNIVAYKAEKIDGKRILVNFTNKLQRPELANNPLVASKLLENQFTKELREYLSSKLPQYMIPEHYILLDKLPLTINGKLDRKALPEASFTSVESYAPPSNALEEQIHHIWAEVLGLPGDKVGIRDDFFRLGGNSILAIKLATKLSREQNTKIAVSDIFKCSTVEKLASYLKNNSTEQKIGTTYEF